MRFLFVDSQLQCSQRVTTRLSEIKADPSPKAGRLSLIRHIVDGDFWVG
jgi:hypothetical protein